MGVNKIGNIYQPTHYVKIDYSPFDGGRWQDEIMLDRPALLWDVFRDGVKDPDKPFGDQIPEGIGEQKNVTWVSRCRHHGDRGYQGQWHDPFCTAYNSMVPMVQWAIQLGYDEIYLLGCDLNFTDGKDDHFMRYYDEVDTEYRERNNRCVLEAHKLIQRSTTIPIVNCTIGGQLELYPRADMRDILKGKDNG